jgi:hypothetical protein
VSRLGAWLASREAGKLLFVLPAVIFLGVLWFSLTGPVGDSDSWWHLATGRWIWEHRQLPTADPFGVSPAEPVGASRLLFVLQQYWLAQVTSYGILLATGFHGLIVLRATLLAGMFSVLYKLLRRAGAGVGWASVLILWGWGVIVGEIGYIGDRPQLWSSLLGMVVLFLLDDLRRGRPYAAWALPATMCLWGNLHAGYVLGIAVVAVTLAATVVTRACTRCFLVACLAALAAAGLNPRGFAAVGVVASTLYDPGSALWGAIVESQSILSHAGLPETARRLPILASLAVASVASLLLALPRWRRLRADRVAVFLLAAVMGTASIRYLVFAVPVALITMAANVRLASGMMPLPVRRAARRLRLAAAVLLPVVAAIPPLLTGVSRSALASPRPYDTHLEGGVAFIRRHDLAGNLFGSYTDGGRLTWELADRARIFIDGRSVSPDMYWRYREIFDRPFETDPRGVSQYQAGLERFGVDMVMIPGVDPLTGAIVPLALALLRDPAWALVHADASIMLFLRGATTRPELVGAARLPSAAGYDHIIALARAAAGTPHGRRMPDWLLATALALSGKRDPAGAVTWLDQYLARRPGDSQARQLRAELAAVLPR